MSIRNKKLKKKKSARIAAKDVIRNGMRLEPMPATTGMITPALTVDIEAIAAAEGIMMAAGYSGGQANVIINNYIQYITSRATGCMG